MILMYVKYYNEDPYSQRARLKKSINRYKILVTCQYYQNVRRKSYFKILVIEFCHIEITFYSIIRDKCV